MVLRLVLSATFESAFFFVHFTALEGDAYADVAASLFVLEDTPITHPGQTILYKSKDLFVYATLTLNISHCPLRSLSNGTLV